MSRSPGKFVDLAAMSMSGTLSPSIPVQVLLKYNPPKLTVVYHFENKENDQYYHDIVFDKQMLENETDEDIVSHLYMSEAYYFNPKCLKRHQVVRLVSKIKNHMNFYGSDKSPERHSIHGNSPSPIRHRGNMDMPMPNNLPAGSKRNQTPTQNQFLKQNIDGIPMPNRSPPRNSNSSNSHYDKNGGSPNLENQNLNYHANSSETINKNTNDILQNNQNSFQQMQQQSAFQRRKNFFERKRFLNYQAHNPSDFQNLTNGSGSQGSENGRNSASPAQNEDKGNKAPSHSPQQENHDFNNVQEFNQSPYVQEETEVVSSKKKNKLAPLEMKSGNKSNKRAAASAAHDRMPMPIDNDKNQRRKSGEEQQPEEIQDPYKEQENQNLENSNTQSDTNLTAQQQDGEPTTGDDGEQVSVYMKDNMIMRRIQIEGDDREFLMDPQGQIFDMNGQFIGTANTNELEELQEDSQQNDNQNNQENNNQQQEEMMLLDDDDDLLLPEQQAQAQNIGDTRGESGNREI